MYNIGLNTLTHTLPLNINILSCWNFLGCQHILMHILGSLFRILVEFLYAIREVRTQCNPLLVCV
jgi:hypothetical protein